MSGAGEVDMDRLRALWLQKLTAASIGSELGLSSERVRCLARSVGLARGRAPVSVPREEMSRLWRDGVPIGEIARRYRVSKPYVSKLAAVWELPPRGAPRRRRVPVTVTANRQAHAQPRPGAAAPAVQTHPNWPAWLDNRLRETGGSHRARAALAVETGRSEAALQARWLLIRGRA